MERWVRIGDADAFSRHAVLTASVDVLRIAVFCTQAGLFAIEDRCPHRGGRLSQGLLYEPCKVACPDHGWGIDLRTGQAEPPERGEVRTFEAKIEDNAVWVKMTGCG